jgi:GntR family transcriptional regulator
MHITINLQDGVPIYRQIANQIRYIVASGTLKPGEEIPSIRALALRLKVTPNTVVKAYDELEAAEILEKRQGSGTFVSEGRVRFAKNERERIIEQRIDEVLAEAHQLGVPPNELLTLFRARQARMEHAREKSKLEELDERKLG